MTAATVSEADQFQTITYFLHLFWSTGNEGNKELCKGHSSILILYWIKIQSLAGERLWPNSHLKSVLFLKAFPVGLKL